MMSREVKSGAGEEWGTVKKCREETGCWKGMPMEGMEESRWELLGAGKEQRLVE